MMPGLGLRVLGPERWPEVWAVMRARDFPRVPDSWQAAESAFAGCVAVTGQAEPWTWVALFGPSRQNVAFVDVICCEGEEGRWATPGVVRGLYWLAFMRLGLKAVWVETHGAKALKASLQAGFVALTPLDRTPVLLVLTPGLVPARHRWSPVRQLKNQQGET